MGGIFGQSALSVVGFIRFKVISYCISRQLVSLRSSVDATHHNLFYLNHCQTHIANNL